MFSQYVQLYYLRIFQTLQEKTKSKAEEKQKKKKKANQACVLNVQLLFQFPILQTLQEKQEKKASLAGFEKRSIFIPALNLAAGEGEAEIEKEGKPGRFSQ